MNEPTPCPSRLLRCIASLARWSLGLLLAFWLLLAAAWGVLHGWIVPRIGDYRPQLEAQATRALGLPVRVGGLRAVGQEWLIPAIELTGVALLDPEGHAALQLPRVVVALSPRSLVRWGFEQLVVERPELDVRRATDGRITIAGLPVEPGGAGDGKAADWLFSQGEVLIQGGTLRYTDDSRQAPPLALTGVDIVLRNKGWSHQMRLDATPPASWGDRFTLMGRFREPLLTTHEGNWRRWSGQIYAQFTRVDVSQLRQHVQLDDVQIASGHGALRAWVDVARGQPQRATADVQLADVNATLGRALQPLALRTVAGRVRAGHLPHDGFEVATEGLQFTTGDGVAWPGGNLSLRQQGPQGELRADRLDLAVLAQIASRLPLADAARAALGTYAPQGLVQDLAATWKGPWDAPQSYQAKGRVSGLALAPDAEHPQALGLRGADVDFDLNQSGGKAQLAISDGALVLPGIFEEPVLPLASLSAHVLWQIQGQKIAVQANDLQFANADAAGSARLSWRTSDQARSASRSRFPGVLDLAGALTRADGTRVHRYLPLSIGADVRHYVRDAITAGTASGVQFKVRGDLHDLPFSHPGQQGDFFVAAQLKDVAYAYVPPGHQAQGEPPWPALTQLAGELVFDKASMAVRKASSGFAGSPLTRMAQIEARIPDLAHTVVEVKAQGRGPLPEMLAVVQKSPLAGLTSHALDEAAAGGAADLQLKLSLPIHDMARSKVQGSVVLAGNEVRITPAAPQLSRVRGTVQFSDQGFSLAGVQAQALGGDVRIDGGMANAKAPVQVRAQGTATAEGLRAEKALGLLAELAQKATGSAPYTMALAVRRGVPELQVSTTLQGMALTLPAPLAKSAPESLPVRFGNQLTREAAAGGPNAPLHDQITLELDTLGSATYVRDLGGAQPRVLRGAIALGLNAGESAPLPPAGVTANVRLAHLDVDAWEAVLQAGGAQAAPASPGGSPGGAVQDYLPTVLAVRADTLTSQGRTLHDVVVGGSREGNLWRANLDARELDGYVEYRQGGEQAGRVYARLARLSVPQSTASQVDTLLDEQPSALPALDIVVDDFELRGRKLGRLEIEARNRGGGDDAAGAQREWRLAKFNLTTPEAAFAAHGNWALLAGAGGKEGERRTALDFTLDVRDSGELLARFGMADVVRRGQGRLEGSVSWVGAPINPDYRSMAGQIKLDMESGQFLKADPGLAKLLGVLSLQSLPRRLTLDFRDVFSEGFAFDFVRGDVRIERGVATTNNLQMKGVNAAVLMEGQADLAHETQDLHVVVVPEINAMTASLVATAINPVIGLGSFLAQALLRKPLSAAITQEFRIEGTWTDPRIVRLPRRAPSASPSAQSPAQPSASSPAPGAPE
ncbi:MAG: YhdP family protein [Acidovorax sp.]